MSLDNLKQAVKETADEPAAAAAAAQDPPLQDALIADGLLIEDAPAPPMFGLDTSLKEINDAIRRAEFRSLQTDTLLAKKSKSAKREVLQEFRLNDDDDVGASLANEATIKRLTAENANLRTQVVRFLES